MNAIRWESPVKGRLCEDRLVIGTSIAGPLAVLAVALSAGHVAE